MNQAQQKLEKHRATAIKRGSSPSEYAKEIGMSPQRIGRLLSENGPPPSLAEALRLREVVKINPALWLP